MARGFVRRNGVNVANTSDTVQKANPSRRFGDGPTVSTTQPQLVRELWVDSRMQHRDQSSELLEAQVLRALSGMIAAQVSSSRNRQRHGR